MHEVLKTFLFAMLAFAGPPPAGAQLPLAQVSQDKANDIVVIARRSGAPVWRVDKAGRSLILVGVIEDVSKDTRWSPASLEEALARTDQLIFPDTQEVAVSPFAAVGFAIKWTRQKTLPKGKTLADMLTPAQHARLVALKRRGIIDGDFERRHPFHLALTLQDSAKGRGYGRDASQVARRIAKRQRTKIVPLAKISVGPLAEELFRSRPEEHVPCLMAAVALAEAGPAAVRERSDAWAERRIVASLNSVAEGVHRSCWPAASRYDVTPSTGLTQSIRQLLDRPGLTVGVVSLASLANPGGVLDQLSQAGMTIDGPAWREEP